MTLTDPYIKHVEGRRTEVGKRKPKSREGFDGRTRSHLCLYPCDSNSVSPFLRSLSYARLCLSSFPPPAPFAVSPISSSRLTGLSCPALTNLPPSHRLQYHRKYRRCSSLAVAIICLSTFEFYRSRCKNFQVIFQFNKIKIDSSRGNWLAPGTPNPA